MVVTVSSECEKKAVRTPSEDRAVFLGGFFSPFLCVLQFAFQPVRTSVIFLSSFNQVITGHFSEC